MTIEQTQSHNPLFEYNFRELSELKKGDQVILHNDQWTRPWSLTVYKVFSNGKVSFWEYNRGGNRRSGINIKPNSQVHMDIKIERQERVGQ